MKIRFIICSVFLLSLMGCTTVQYNGAPTNLTKVDYPPVGVEKTAYIGDPLVKKGTLAEEKLLVVTEATGGSAYTIPAIKYMQIGHDKVQDFYAAAGVTAAFWADPVKALAVKKEDNAKICVITVFNNSFCYQGQYEKKTMLSARDNSFQQTLIYSGRIGDKINISYREFTNDMARPAFNNDAEYDLKESKTIGYKGALLEVIEANNSQIIYKLIRNFPDYKH